MAGGRYLPGITNIVIGAIMTTYLIVRVLGVSPGEGVNEGHISISVPERFGATPPTHNMGAMNTDIDACDISGYALRHMEVGDLATVDTDLIW